MNERSISQDFEFKTYTNHTYFSVEHNRIRVQRHSTSTTK